MDSRMPQNNDEGYTNNDMFGDNQQFNAYDNLNLFQPNAGPDSQFSDSNWLNTPDYANQPTSRAQPWQGQSHLAPTSAQASFNGRASPYGRLYNQSPASFDPTSFGGNLNRASDYAYRPQQYDPSLASQPGNAQNYNVGIQGYNHHPAPNGTTVTPQALEREAHQPSFPGNPYNTNGSFPFAQSQPTQHNAPPQHTRLVDHKALSASIPKGADSGMFSIIDFEHLARATSSERIGNFVNVGTESMEFDCSRMAIPAYVQRRSRNDIAATAFASGNTRVLAKIGKKSANAKTSALNNAKVSPGTTASGSNQLKYEEESSSSEDSSDDDSTYSDDDDDVDSPLPAKRPADPKGGVEYDTIKALWRSKKKTLTAEVIRQSLVEFWELVKTIRDRWKADSQAVTDAEKKNRVGELSLLQSRVKDQRDMIEAAFKAALKHGHRSIVELLSENVALTFLCYQFLLDRIKSDDFNGSLSRAILETMAQFTTLTKDKMEKVHLVKVLPRFQKNGDAKTQYWVKKINTNSEAASKESVEKPVTKQVDTITERQAASPPSRKAMPESTVGVKRAAAGAPGEGNVAKKVATGTTKSSASTASKVNGATKKPAGPSESSKSSTTTSTTTKKAVAAKPSGFFSNLQSASKKPGTSMSEKTAAAGVKAPAGRSTATTTSAPKPAFSFAETMANLTKSKEQKPAPTPQKELPPETDEERTKRLRKETRRKLNVRFKSPEDLVEIRYFTHDPDEEIDHDSSQMRDVADVGGEGRMFKQQSQMMDLDDEDDAEEEGAKPYPVLSVIDFSGVDAEERKRNYAPYGGGQLEVQSAERSVRDEYERNNLIVFYTDRDQIPPNPREPTDAFNGEQLGPTKYFAQPEDKYAARARDARAPKPGTSNVPGQSFNQQSTTPANPDIQSILASLRQTTPAQTPQATPQSSSSAISQPYMTAQTTAGFPPSAAPSAPTAPPANIDLAAILASLNPQAAQQSSYPGPMQNSHGFGAISQQQQQPDNSMHDFEVAKIRAKNPNYKTKVCRFWQEGRCQKGDNCSYLHE